MEEIRKLFKELEEAKVDDFDEEYEKEWKKTFERAKQENAEEFNKKFLTFCKLTDFRGISLSNNLIRGVEFRKKFLQNPFGCYLYLKTDVVRAPMKNDKYHIYDNYYMKKGLLAVSKSLTVIGRDLDVTKKTAGNYVNILKSVGALNVEHVQKNEVRFDAKKGKNIHYLQKPNIYVLGWKEGMVERWYLDENFRGV